MESVVARAGWWLVALFVAIVAYANAVDAGFAVVDGVLDGQNTTLVVALYGTPVAKEVAGSGVTAAGDTAVTFTAPAVAKGGTNPLSYFGSALLSLSPVTILVLGMLAIVAIVGAVAHHYRTKLPKAWQQNWKKNHGIYTFIGMISLGVVIILATGGGSL